MLQENGITTTEKEVVKSQRGGVSETRQTMRAFEKNAVIQAKNEAPLTKKMNSYLVMGNILRNDKSYKKGDILEEPRSKAIDMLVQLGKLTKQKKEAISDE